MAGLYDNIHAKRKRIDALSLAAALVALVDASGSNEKMRKKGAKGAPTAKAFKQAAKTTKRSKK